MVAKSTTLRWPENLHELMKGDQSGWSLRRGYILTFHRDLVGISSPVHLKGTEQVFLTFDLDILEKVLKTLPPKDFEIMSFNFMMNRYCSFAFEVLKNPKEARPWKFFTSFHFEVFHPSYPPEFQWGFCLMDANLSQAEYDNRIKSLLEIERADIQS